MNGGESGNEKKRESFKVEVTFNMKRSTITSLCLHESLFSDFFLTHAHPTFVYKLNINNHKTVSNEKDMNNLFN